MPITVQPAPHLTTVGPGLQINLISDFIGPMPADAIWQVAITIQPDQVQPVLFYSKPCTGDFDALIVLNAEGWNETRQAWWPTQGGGINVHAQISTQTGIIDSGALSTTWDATSGVPWLLHAQAQGGFTEQDREQLALSVSNTIVDMTDTSLPTDIHSVPVGRLFTQHPLVWNERVGPFVITGRGAISLAPGVNRGWYTGMRWFFTVIPPGWGETPGAIDEFDNRPAQLVPVYVMESGEEIGSPILDVQTSGGWQELNSGWGLARVEYDVSPGWQLTVFMYRIIGSG